MNDEQYPCAECVDALSAMMREKELILQAADAADLEAAYADLKPQWDIVSRAAVPLPKQAPRRRHLQRRLQRGRNL